MTPLNAKLLGAFFVVAGWSIGPLVHADPVANGASAKAQTSYPVCGSFCAMQYRACRKAAEAEETRCDTQFVSCEASCIDCVPAAQACLRSSGGAPGACTGPFLTCIRGSLADRDAAKAPPIRFDGGDGTSLKTAVVILGARNESEGIVAENLWTAKHHDGWRKADQALIHDGGRSFDKIGYRTPEGQRDIWFDISGFFGKL